MYMVSACIVGISCRYDGKNTLDDKLLELLREGKAIPLCPELLGGLPTPRESCEIVTAEDGTRRVMGRSGADFTNAYREGARKTLEICKIANIKKAILQDRSPSCGYGRIYDGTHTGGFAEGNGITADLLIKNGIEVFTRAAWGKGKED